MAWTPEKVRLLRTLYRSHWSMAAIALVTGQTRMAVINKVYRLRRADADMELDAVRRALWRQSGRAFVDVEKARKALAQAGVREGAERAVSSAQS